MVGKRNPNWWGGGNIKKWNTKYLIAVLEDNYMRGKNGFDYEANTDRMELVNELARRRDIAAQKELKRLEREQRRFERLEEQRIAQVKQKVVEHVKKAKISGLMPGYEGEDCPLLYEAAEAPF